MPDVAAAVDEFLRETRVAVIATVDGHGNVRQTPIWYQWHEGAAHLFTGRRSLKWRNIQARPQASLCVDDREPPYRSVLLEGAVEETDRDMHELVLELALRYYGEQQGREFAEGYRDPNPRVVAFRLVPERVVPQGFE